MALRYTNCKICARTTPTLAANAGDCCGQPREFLLSAPQVEIRERVDPQRNKSVLKGQKEMLAARSKEHSRRTMYEDWVAEQGPEVAKAKGWLNEKGEVKKKIDTT